MSSARFDAEADDHGALDLPVVSIVVDPSLQPRVGGLDLEHVSLLADNPEVWEPSSVVIVDGQHILVDGFHRYAAAQNLGLTSVQVRIVPVPEDGDLRALAFNLNAGQLGRPLSLSDRRAFAAHLLRKHPEWGERRIAEQVGLRQPTVKKVREQLEASAQIEQTTKRIGRSGYTYTVSPAETRKPGELPPSSVLETIKQGLSARERREQRAVASYLERLAVALEDGLNLAAWDTEEEAAEACRAVLGPEKAQALGKRLYLSREVYQVSCLLQAVEE
jgi:ParB-like chromosome segregation protein Spo0J